MTSNPQIYILCRNPGFYRSHFVLMANLYIQWLHYLAVVALSRIITSIDTVLPWWHSIDAMLVLPASMASPLWFLSHITSG